MPGSQDTSPGPGDPAADRVEDPVVRSARREALTVLGVWLVALAWTVGYCTARGYSPETATTRFVLGLPEWVFWGIVVPWFACIAFGCWFSSFGMEDAVLEEAHDTREADAPEVERA